MTNKISIIIPIYNSKKHINGLIQTLKAQDFEDFEVIIVDDASTDGTWEILNKEIHFAGIRIHSFRQPSNQGPGVARNTGIEKSKGDYICFLDADDEISSGYLSNLYSTAEIYDSELVISNAIRKYQNGKMAEHYNSSKIQEYLNDKYALLYLISESPWGKLIKKDFWVRNAFKFPSSIKAEDKAVMPAVIFDAERVSVADQAIYYYVQTKSSRSRNSQRSYEDIFTAFTILENRMNDSDALSIRALLDIGYGCMKNAIKAGANNAVLSKYSDYLKEKYTNAYNDSKFRLVRWEKRLLIRLAYIKAFTAMRLLLSIEGMYKK